MEIAKSYESLYLTIVHLCKEDEDEDDLEEADKIMQDGLEVEEEGEQEEKEEKWEE